MTRQVQPDVARPFITVAEPQLFVADVAFRHDRPDARNGAQTQQADLLHRDSPLENDFDCFPK